MKMRFYLGASGYCLKISVLAVVDWIVCAEFLL